MKEKKKSTVGKKRKSRAILKHDDSSESDESVTFDEKKVAKFDSDRSFRKRKEKVATVSESEESDDSENKYALHVNKKLRNNEEDDDRKSGKASRTDNKLIIAENVNKVSCT